MSFEGKLTMLASAIRDKLGVDTTFTLDDMARMIGGFQIKQGDDGNWKVECPAVDIQRLCYINLDSPSVEFSAGDFEKSNGFISGWLEDGETVTKSCSWKITAPPQGGTFTLVTNCYEPSDSKKYLAAVVKDKEVRAYDYTALSKTNVGENGLCYKDDLYNWKNKDIEVKVPLEPGETCVITFFGCVSEASSNRGSLIAKTYRIEAKETTLIDGIEPVTGGEEEVDATVVLKKAMSDAKLPFTITQIDGNSSVGANGNLLEVSASNGGCNCVYYFFTPKKDTSMYVDAVVDSEANWDWGFIAVDTMKWSFSSYDKIKNWKGLDSGSSAALVLRDSGSNKTSDKNKEIKLKGGQSYYLSLIYAKDSGGSSGKDRLMVKSIRFVFKSTVDNRVYHLSKHNYKMQYISPDDFTTMTDERLKCLDYSHCTTYEEMFDGCAGLTEITLDVSNIPVPEGLRNVIHGCTALKKITFTGLTAENEVLVTGELIGNTTAVIVTKDASGKTLRKREITAEEIEQIKAQVKEDGTLVIPDGVISIPEKAFLNAGTVKKAVIPDSVESIGAYAFYNCTFDCNLKAGEVKTIGSYAFMSGSARAWGGALSSYHTWQFPQLDTLGEGAFMDQNTESTAYSFVFGSPTHGVSRVAADSFSNFAGFEMNDVGNYSIVTIYSNTLNISDTLGSRQKTWDNSATKFQKWTFNGIEVTVKKLSA